MIPQVKMRHQAIPVRTYICLEKHIYIYIYIYLEKYVYISLKNIQKDNTEVGVSRIDKIIALGLLTEIPSLLPIEGKGKS